jgi:integrase/recombinase XerD
MARRTDRSRPTSPRGRRQPDWTDRIPGPPDRLPDQVQQYLDWLRIQKNRPATTVRAYRQDLAKFVAFIGIQDDFCRTVDRNAIREYQIALADVIPHPRSRARALVALRQFLGYAYDEGWLVPEMSRHVTIPRFVSGDPHPVPTENVPRLLAALPKETLRDLRDRALVHLLISSGCRISEALALDRNAIQKNGFRVLGKGGKYRTVYCTDDAFDAVNDYLIMRGPDPSPALFISVAHADIPKGKALRANRLTTDGARHALNALKRRMGRDAEIFDIVSDLRSPHAARHTAATTLLEATDGDVRLVQEVLGHATLETLKVYTEITDKRKRAAYDRLGEYLGDIAQGQRP